MNVLLMARAGLQEELRNGAGFPSEEHMESPGCLVGAEHLILSVPKSFAARELRTTRGILLGNCQSL